MNIPGTTIAKNKIVNWRKIVPNDVSYMFFVT